MRAFQKPDLGVVRLVGLLVTTAIGLYVCYLLIVPFLPALVWALTAAVLAAPLHHAIASRLRRPNLSAAISVALLVLVIVVPVVLLGQHLAGTVQTGIATVQANFTSGDLQQVVQRHPWLAWIEGPLTGKTL